MKPRHIHCIHKYSKPALPFVLVKHEYCCECGKEFVDEEEKKQDLQALAKYVYRGK